MINGLFKISFAKKSLTNRYQEETKLTPFQIGKNQKCKEALKGTSLAIKKTKRSLNIPLYQCSVSAGFPFPAHDGIEKALDLKEHLIKHPAATFFVRVSGNSMINAGIYDHDILIVDRSLNPKSGSVIVAVLNGDLTVKRFQKKDGLVFLLAENPHYKSIKVTDNMDFSVWGVVTTVLHNLC